MELTIQDLTKEFGTLRAVDHVNFTMTNGVYGLLGVNGAGKTTLMRMLTTLINPTSGKILWDGQDVFALDGPEAVGISAPGFRLLSRLFHL